LCSGRFALFAHQSGYAVEPAAAIAMRRAAGKRAMRIRFLGDDRPDVAETRAVLERLARDPE
jgi:hypothetical protein